MRITSIGFGDDETPESITAVLTITELALLYRLTGHVSPRSVTEAANGDGDYGTACSEIAACAGSLFNRFYDEGVDGFAPRFGAREIAERYAERDAHA